MQNLKSQNQTEKQEKLSQPTPNLLDWSGQHIYLLGRRIVEETRA